MTEPLPSEPGSDPEYDRMVTRKRELLAAQIQAAESSVDDATRYLRSLVDDLYDVALAENPEGADVRRHLETAAASLRDAKRVIRTLG